MNPNRKNLLIISREPAPYKVDLFNCFANSDEWTPFVFYAQAKDWQQDAGHDFRDLPNQCYAFNIIRGKSAASVFLGLWWLVRKFREFKPDVTIVSGYGGFLPLMAIFLCILTRYRFAVWTDCFNLGYPSYWGAIGLAARSLIRKIIFRQASVILMCGSEGVTSAVMAGCPFHKVVNFPYVVDAQRLLSSGPVDVPSECIGDLANNKTVLMFSGRHIARKGLPTFLEAIASSLTDDRWIAWIEGDGPLRGEYESLSSNLGIKSRCRFLGFCQMHLHSWLISHADIIVVPSLQDAWGIVVDEGMQVGKVVCASNGAFSALDRIVHGENGFLFDAGNSSALADLLVPLMCQPDLRNRIGLSALETARVWTPQRNVDAFSRSFATETQHVRTRS